MLAGYAIAVQGAPMWDHTYVASDDGKSWGCWGRDSGGAQICDGNGDSALAACLSRPKSHAGIDYAITGVCHQTANRILYPARILVDAARGYGASAFTWGTYGLGSWPELQRCVRLAKSGSRPPSLKAGGSRTMAARKRSALARKIEKIYRTPTTAKELRSGVPRAALELKKKELKALADVSLGKGYDPRKLAAVAGLQARLHDRQRELAARLESKELAPEAYLDALNALSISVFSQCEKVLGPRDFRALFGIDADRVGEMIDRQAFLKAHPH